MQVEIKPLQASELDEAYRICQLAFGTFLNLPDPAATFGDRDMMGPRFRAGSPVLAAHADGRLIGSNVITRWGSFGYFGPLTVLPEFWDKGVAQLLLEETVRVFDRWGVRHSGLFTFPASPKHIGLYQKFGYWPQYLTAVMRKTPTEESKSAGGVSVTNLEEAARELTGSISPGLDVTNEIQMAEAVAVSAGNRLDAFAVCHIGPGTEGGSGVCYVKFGAARNGESFDRLLAAIESLAFKRGAVVEAGVNLAREDAYRRMRARGYRALIQGVAMQRPHAPAFNRPDAYVLDDWR